MDAAIDFNLLGVILVRLFVVSASVEFYFGFVLPDYVKRFFKIPIEEKN